MENQPLLVQPKSSLQRQRTIAQKRVSFAAGDDLESARSYGTIQSSPLMKQGSRRMLGVQTKLNADVIKKGVRQGRKTRQQHSADYSMLRRHSYRWPAYIYRIGTRSLIFVSTVNFILETEVYFQHCCTEYFNVFEAVISTLFLMEYVLKLRTVDQRKVYAGCDYLQAVFDFILSSESFIDLVSCLPFFAEVSLGINPGRYELLRMLRLFRLFKLSMLWDAFRMVVRVVYFNAQILGSAFLVCFIMLLVCSVMLFYTRPPVEMDHIDNFSSVLACMYLAILMLTGQGEPDGQLPWYTRVVVSVTALFAIAQFAIPAAMLTWGFEQEAEQNIVKNNSREEKVIGHFLGGTFSADIVLSSSSSDESDRHEEWESYRKQVAGEEESSSSAESEDLVDEPEFNTQLLDPNTLMSNRQIETVSKGNAVPDLTPFEKKRAKLIFKLLATSRDDGSKAIEKAVIYELEGKEDEIDVKQEGLDLFDNMCQKLDAGGNVVPDVQSRETGCIKLSQLFRWLDYVKKNFPRYGDAIFLRILDTLEDKAEEIAKKKEDDPKEIEKEGKLEAESSKRRLMSGRRLRTLGQSCSPCGVCPKVMSRARKCQKPFDSAYGPFAEQMRRLQAEKVAWQAKIAALENELLTLKGEY
jgi:voltage-gated potassium channel